MEFKANFTVTVDSKYLEYLRALSYSLTEKEQKKVGVSELVRRALESHYPISDVKDKA